MRRARRARPATHLTKLNVYTHFPCVRTAGNLPTSAHTFPLSSVRVLREVRTQHVNRQDFVKSAEIQLNKPKKFFAGAPPPRTPAGAPPRTPPGLRPGPPIYPHSDAHVCHPSGPVATQRPEIVPESPDSTVPAGSGHVSVCESGRAGARPRGRFSWPGSFLCLVRSILRARPSMTRRARGGQRDNAASTGQREARATAVGIPYLVP